MPVSAMTMAFRHARMPRRLKKQDLSDRKPRAMTRIDATSEWIRCGCCQKLEKGHVAMI